MENKELLRQIVVQQKAEVQKEGVVRRLILDEILKWLPDKRVLILTGVRRCGKSTLLRQIMEGRSDYCYVNFDDERFIGFKAKDFEQLNEILIEVYKNPKIYFFDEIQNIDQFETFVRRLQDQGKKIVITGSNASLLSKELGTRLTGRYKSFEVYPFSFKEYLVFQSVAPEKDWFHIAEKKVRLQGLFKQYLVDGGFPEYLKNHDADYLKTVFENILYRDIIARYAIRKQRIVRELVNLLTTSISSTFTYNSLKTSLGLANSNTVKEYISYLGNSYLFFELAKTDFSLKKQLASPKKAYLVDTAFHQASGLNFSQNKGRLLENLVFVELKRRNKDVAYFSGKKECDFIVKDGNKISFACQVCFNLTEDNQKREVDGLVEALEAFKLKGGQILTMEQEDELKVGGKTIKILPVWKWLLTTV
ncbi:MAG: ATP-binding protein [Candidatus Micrarchaeota archaeon]